MHIHWVVHHQVWAIVIDFQHTLDNHKSNFAHNQPEKSQVNTMWVNGGLAEIVIKET